MEEPSGARRDGCVLPHVPRSASGGKSEAPGGTGGSIGPSRPLRVNMLRSHRPAGGGVEGGGAGACWNFSF